MSIGTSQRQEPSTILPLIYQRPQDKDTEKSTQQFNSILVCSGTTSPSESLNTSRYGENFRAEAMSSSAEDVTTGFWTLKCTDLLDDLVLSKFDVLNDAAEMTIATPTRKNWGTTTASYEPVYALKRDFVQSSNSETLVSVEKFSRSSECYDWKSDNPPLKEDHPVSADGFCLQTKFETSSSHSSVVTWKAGLSQFRIDYCTIYRFNAKRINKENEVASEIK